MTGGDGRETYNLGTTVYLALGERLTKGRLRPNDRLRIRELAEELGTSVTPVRDAVLRLVQDRALVMRSPRDIRVPLLSEREFTEIRTIRIRLEELAVATAATTLDQAGVDGLRALLARSAQAIRDGDGALAIEINQVFHDRLVELAEMPNLRRMLGRLWLQTGPLIAVDDPQTSRAEHLRHHEVLVDALARRDGQGAVAAIRDDIMDGSTAILERIRRSDGGAARADGS